MFWLLLLLLLLSGRHRTETQVLNNQFLFVFKFRTTQIGWMPNIRFPIFFSIHWGHAAKKRKEDLIGIQKNKNLVLLTLFACCGYLLRLKKYVSPTPFLRVKRNVFMMLHQTFSRKLLFIMNKFKRIKLLPFHFYWNRFKHFVNRIVSLELMITMKFEKFALKLPDPNQFRSLTMSC